jgi:4-amino-4-deoxy-L-arabinose transferase-like glycosyltransferase
MIATRETTQTVPLAGRIEREKLLSALGLAGVLTLSAALNLWNLANNGYSNLYYSTAVQSMVQSWHNFFFASYDAGGFITVDKPPVALWVQALSVKLFGFNSLALLVPEALAGVASVALLYFLVKRLFGPLAGFIAALALALTPIAVAVERTNNTDSWLMFTLLLAAWALTLATEQGRFRLLALSMALVGVAFNIKMLAAWVVLPAFVLLYLLAARVAWPQRMLHLALGGLVVLAVSLSWPLAVDLTPANLRPWVGGSQSNSVVELALGYNGLGRVTGQGEFGGRGGTPPGGFNGGGRGFPGGVPPGGGAPGFGRGGANGSANGGLNGANMGMFGAGFAGPTRLFTGGELPEQWSWLFPLAAFGVLAALLGLRRVYPVPRRGQALLLWGGWLATYGVVFSMAQGIFHPYYLIMLAPATAALAGIGVAALWTAYRQGGWQAWLLPLALLVTAIWQMQVLSAYPAWSRWLIPITFGGTVLAAVPLVATRLFTERAWRQWAPGLTAAGVVALFASPLVWSVTPALAAPSNASLPIAGPSALTNYDPASWTQMTNTANSALVAYLEAHSAGYTYLVAVTNSQQASPLALATGKPVLAAGGFMGSDPALTADKLAELVATRQVRFVLGLGGGFGGRSFSNTAVSGWIQANCQAVDPGLYGGTTALPGGRGFGGFGGGNAPLYDCTAAYQ